MKLTQYIQKFKQREFCLHYSAALFKFKEEDCTTEKLITFLKKGTLRGNCISFVTIGLFLSGCSHEQVNNFISAMVQIRNVQTLTYDLSFVTNVAIFKPLYQDRCYTYSLMVPALTIDNEQTFSFKLEHNIYYNLSIEQSISYIFNKLLDRLKYNITDTNIFSWDFRIWGFYTIVDGQLHLEKAYQATPTSLSDLHQEMLRAFKSIDSSMHVRKHFLITSPEDKIKRLQQEVQTLKRKLEEKDRPHKKRRTK